MVDKPLIFISHITEEAELAHLFKREIKANFLNMVEVLYHLIAEVSLSALIGWMK
jgi:hypothetical protein